MKKIIFVFLFILVHSTTMEAAEEINFIKGSFSDALSKAKEQNKLVFVDCFTTWCGPCKWMSANIFTNDTVQKYFNEKFVCIALDMEKGEGKDVAKKYAVKNYPTFLWLNSEGNDIHRSVGATDAQNFLAIAGQAIDPAGNLSYMQRQYTSGNREPALVLKYAHSLKDAYDTKYQTVADEYFSTLPENELASVNNWKAIHKFTPTINSHTYNVISKSRSLFNDRYGKDSVDNLMDNLALNSLDFAKQQKDSVMLKNVIIKLKESNNPDVLEKGLLGELNFYKGNKNFIKYTALAHEYVNAYFLDDPKTLNAICWTYFMNVNDKDKLAEAEKWIAKSVELDDQYYNTDTYANILHKQGKRKEAIAMTNHSIEMAKKSGEDYSSTQDLLNELLKE